MAFFKNVKRALGFSDNNDAGDYSANVYKGGDKEREPYINPFKKESSGNGEGTAQSKSLTVIRMDSETGEADDGNAVDNGLNVGVPEGLFDGVIDVVNSSLPGLVKDCIDEDAQKKYLYNILDESFTQYVRKLQDKAVDAAQAKWDKERVELMEKLRESEAKVDEAAVHREEARNQFLSLERQKRAVSDRVHDLEGRVASLESEIEQYQLENKSLVNKLKVSQVKGDDIDYFKREIEQYQVEVNSYKKKVAGYADVDNRIAELEKRIAELTGENEELKAGCEKLKDEKLKLDVSNSLVTELNERIRATEKENDILRSEADGLRENVRLGNEKLERVRKELDEANSGLEIVAEIEAQLDRVEEMKKRKDAKIASLSVRVSELEKERDELSAKVASFNSFIKDGAFVDKSFGADTACVTASGDNDFSGDTDKAAGDELMDTTANADLISFEGLDDFEISEGMPAEETKDADGEDIKGSTVKISAIDDSIDAIDWLMLSPPNQAPAPAEPEATEDTVKPGEKHSDSAQMTLF